MDYTSITDNINDTFNNPDTFPDYSFYDCRPSNTMITTNTNTTMSYTSQDQTSIQMSSTPCYTPSPTLSAFNTNADMNMNTNYLYNTNLNTINAANNYYPTMMDATTAAATSTISAPIMTADAVYSFMVDLEKYDLQTFNNLLSALNSIRSPTDFVVSQSSSVMSSATSFSSNNNENMNVNVNIAAVTANGNVFVQSPTTSMTSSMTSLTSSLTHAGCGCAVRTKSDFASKKVSNPSASAARSKIAKKFYAEGGDAEGEYYYCVDCGERRKANTFASEGHYHNGKLRVRWRCPMCCKNTAVTYRTTHLNTKHNIEKAEKVTMKKKNKIKK